MVAVEGRVVPSIVHIDHTYPDPGLGLALAQAREPGIEIVIGHRGSLIIDRDLEHDLDLSLRYL